MLLIGNTSCTIRFVWIQMSGVVSWRGKIYQKQFEVVWKNHNCFHFVLTNLFFPLLSNYLYVQRCPERALDTHIYQAWRDPDSRIGFFSDACNNKRAILALEQAFGPVIVGEWSLATE